MWRNTIKSSFRSIIKNRSHTLINLIGLSFGITAAIILALVVKYELSFDNYHLNGKRIFRAVTERINYGEQDYTSGITYPLVEAMRNDFPDIEYATITDANQGDPVLGIAQPDGSMERFKETLVAFADPEYFKMFSYQFIEGGPDALLTEKSIVLSQSLARKYFGDSPAVGKIINYNNLYDLTVTGVVKDAPKNTDLPFRAIISYRLGADKHGWEDWDSSSSSINCYVQLKPGVNADDLQDKMKGWHLKYFTGDNKEAGETRTYFLQPLSTIHFDQRFTNYSDKVISKTTIWSLVLIGLLLLVTACINFVNLNTVLIFNRAKEVGIRKTMGGSRFHLMAQFLGETFMIAAVAVLLSSGLAELSLIQLAPILGYQLNFEPLTDGFTFQMLLIFPFLITLLAGLYPAISLATFNPIRALKNKIVDGETRGLTLRRSLIVVQLIISQVLIICTLVVLNQMDYFMSRPMGLNSSAIIEFELPENKNIDLLGLKDRLANVPGVSSVSMSNNGSVSESTWGGEFEADVNGTHVKKDVVVKFADEDYVKTYQLKLLVGEDFVRSDSVDRFLVNEEFVHALGLSSNEEAIGVPVEVWGRKAMISGVVKNFNSSSLKDEILPLIIIPDKRRFFICAVKLNSADVREVMGSIESQWQHYFPTYIFEYTFLDDTIRKFYEQERRTSNLLSLFSGIAILIGCIGLFGLVSFMVAKKTKEVGIRKTLGASVANIMMLFTREFIALIVVSFIISAPLAYYFMGEWLDNFAYRISPGIGIFCLGVLLLTVVVLGTVGFKSLKAAVANPIDALKDE